MFHKAERKRSKLRLALYGITNSGKTYSALRIAKGIGGKIAMIDTESGRGEFYSEEFDYDVKQIEAPFAIQKYVEIIKAAEKASYNVLIIDSLSHAWSGQGGILSVVDDSGSNKFGGWKHATPLQNELIETITNSKMHIIVTMRAKAEWVLELNEKGKQAPRKVGMGFVQREGVDYEFTVVMQMSPEKNIAYVEKDNTRNYNHEYVQPSEEMGAKFIEWLNSGIDVKEYFKNHTLPFILQEIQQCNNEMKLREVYAKYYQQYANDFMEEFEAVIKEKDKLKDIFIKNHQPKIDIYNMSANHNYPNEARIQS